MNDINTITLSGVIVKDPEQKTIGKSNTLIVNSAVQSRQTYYKKGGEEGETIAHLDVEAMGKVGEELRFCRLGDRVVISGKMSSRSWQKEGTEKVIWFQALKAEIVTIVNSKSAKPADQPAERGSVQSEPGELPW